MKPAASQVVSSTGLLDILVAASAPQPLRTVALTLDGQPAATFAFSQTAAISTALRLAHVGAAGEGVHTLSAQASTWDGAQSPADTLTFTLDLQPPDVALATAVFVVACSSVGMSSDALSRVLQGIVTGIGFLGAGSILKLNEQRDIQGLTTAAGVWMTAAIGIAAGLGSLGVALLSAFFTVIVLLLAGTGDAEERRPTTDGERKANDE